MSPVFAPNWIVLASGVALGFLIALVGAVLFFVTKRKLAIGLCLFGALVSLIIIGSLFAGSTQSVQFNRSLVVTPTALPVVALPSITPTPVLSGLVEIGGRSLLIQCQGTGTPAIIIEAGLNEPGATSGTWDRVITQVADATRVCAYDRANLGKSGATTKPRTSADIAQDLHRLLNEAHIAGPYVLVGHSMGGYHVRVYASRYPDKLVGIVLVDSSHPDQFSRFLNSLPAEAPTDSQQLKSLREYFTISPANPAPNREGFDILASAAQVRGVGTLGSLPLIVVTRSSKTNVLNLSPDLNDRVENTWLELQAELTQLSSNSLQLFASKAGHNIQRDEPQVVSEAILQMVQQIKDQKQKGK